MLHSNQQTVEIVNIMRFKTCLVPAGFIVFFITGLINNSSALPTTKLLADLLAQGLLQIKRGEPELALVTARKAIELDANIPESYFLLGRAQQDIGLKSDSLSSYTTAISLNPHYSFAYSNRGLVKASTGEYVEAIKDFNQAIKIDGKFAAAYLNRGVARGATGDARAALKDFSIAINLNPKYTEAYQNRGIARELVGDMSGACSDWKIAATNGSKDALLWYNNQCL